MNDAFVVHGNGFRFDCTDRTYVMGILNVTPDSFSDGGVYLDLETAVAHGLQMAEEGADIIDIGGESTRPGSKAVTQAEELQRVLPVIERLSRTLTIPVSIDTCKAEVARQAIGAGARIVNDVSGMTADPEMGPTVAKAEVPVILMHAKGTPEDMQRSPWYKDTISEIKTWLAERIQYAEAAGIRHSHILIDPGIGFGKRVSDNLLILKSVKTLHPLACPVVIGPSRKAFIGSILDLPEQERLEGTAAAITLGIAHGAHLIRVHDVAPMVRIARMTDAIVRARQE